VRENAVNGQSSGVNQPSRTARVVGSVRQAVSTSRSASITARVVNGGAGGPDWIPPVTSSGTSAGSVSGTGPPSAAVISDPGDPWAWRSLSPNTARRCLIEQRPDPGGQREIGPAVAALPARGTTRTQQPRGIQAAQKRGLYTEQLRSGTHRVDRVVNIVELVRGAALFRVINKRALAALCLIATARGPSGVGSPLSGPALASRVIAGRSGISRTG